MPYTQRFVLPGIGRLAQTYAAGPVWRGSTTSTVRFTTMPKKAAIRLYERAKDWNRKTHQPGRHGGILGRVALAVLETLIFDFQNYRTGQLDPSYEGIARKAGVSRASVWRALVRLRALGLLSWVRRCVGEMRGGRYVLTQERNAYSIQAEPAWKGYRMPLEPPTAPQPGTWGEHTPMLSAVAQAVQDQTLGKSRGDVLFALESDAGDGLAAALARLGRSMTRRENEGLPGVSM